MNMIVIKEHEISFHRITLSTLQCSVPLQEKDKRGQKEFEMKLFISYSILFYFLESETTISSQIQRRVRNLSAQIRTMRATLAI